MYFYNIIKTLLSKIAILLINFALVILTTHLWGTEGRGLISILVANMAIIVILNNVLGGGCISYFAPKFGFNKLIVPAYLWIIIISLIGSYFITQFQHQGNFNFLLVLTILYSLLYVQLLLFVGKENFKLFNILTLLLPVLLLIFTLFFQYVLGIKSFKSYIYGYIIALGILWLFSILKSFPYLSNKKIIFSFKVISDMINYGWQTELSSFLQFFNYRLSYYFILYYKGISSVGIFSVGIALSESIWMISNSISLVQYARIINNIDKDNGLDITKSSVMLSMISSLAIVLIMIFLPSVIYGIVFGHNFTSVKTIMLFLFPGIISIAISNIYGHYFSATGQTRILIIKSLYGLVVTIMLSLLLIPKWGITGACITVTISHIVSSGYLFFKFYKKTEFHISDFIPKRKEFQLKNLKSLG